MWDKLQHEMYWNYYVIAKYVEIDGINYNMRCIETADVGSNKQIVTDKLQHEMYWNSNSLYTNFMLVYR